MASLREIRDAIRDDMDSRIPELNDERRQSFIACYQADMTWSATKIGCALEVAADNPDEDMDDLFAMLVEEFDRVSDAWVELVLGRPV